MGQHLLPVDDRESIHAVTHILQASEGPYSFAPQMNRVTGEWREGPPLLWADAVEFVLCGFCEEYHQAGWDRYFTPLKYVKPQRRAENIGRPGVIFADMDGADPYAIKHLQPSVVIRTSENSHHAYWLLTEPVGVGEWVPRAKGLTQALGADPGGWDVTQVLRPPSTFNHKRVIPFPVTVELFIPTRRYSLEQFPYARVPLMEETPPLPIDLATKTDLLIKHWPRLSLSARFWLSMDPGVFRAMGKVDRSRLIWRLISELHEADFSAADIYSLTQHSVLNKWQKNPDVLWKQVVKATRV